VQIAALALTSSPASDTTVTRSGQAPVGAALEVEDAVVLEAHDAELPRVAERVECEHLVSEEAGDAVEPPSGEELGDRDVGALPRLDVAHDVAHRLQRRVGEEIGSAHATHREQEPVGGLAPDRVEPPGAHLGPRVGVGGVDELGALLDGMVAEVSARGHSAADAVRGLDHDHVESGAGTVAGGGDAGHPRPDHHDTVRHAPPKLL
jgi:hypothetical protein